MEEQRPAPQPIPLSKSAPAPAPAPVAEPADGPGFRASDADRDRIADVLREALAEGRLEPEEHAERIDAVYRAKTLRELEPLIRDLPAAGQSGAPSRPYDGGPPSGSRVPPASENLVAVFGGASRAGRWRVRRHTNAFAMFGGIDIDLTEAVFEQKEIMIHAVVLFGGLEIKVPENVTLRGTGAGIFGGFDVPTEEAEDPDAPVVVVSGFAIFGGVDAKRKRGKRLKNLRG